MKLSGKKKFYFLSVAVLSIYGAFIYFIFGPWSFSVGENNFTGIISSIKEKNMNFSSLNEAYYLMAKKRGLLFELEEEYDAIKNKIPLMGGAILSREKALDFLVMIEGLAEKTGVFKEISINNPVKDEKLATNVFPVLFKIYGPFTNVYNFVGYLQNSPWILQMGKIEIAKTEQTSIYVGRDTTINVNEWDVQANLSVKVLSK